MDRERYWGASWRNGFLRWSQGRLPSLQVRGRTLALPCRNNFYPKISLAQAVEQAPGGPCSIQVRNAKYPAFQAGMKAAPTASSEHRTACCDVRPPLSLAAVGDNRQVSGRLPGLRHDREGPVRGPGSPRAVQQEHGEETLLSSYHCEANYLIWLSLAKTSLRQLVPRPKTE